MTQQPAAETARFPDDEFDAEFHCSFCGGSPAPHVYNMPPAPGARHWHGMSACDDCHEYLGTKAELLITVNNCTAVPRCVLTFKPATDVYAHEV